MFSLLKGPEGSLHVRRLFLDGVRGVQKWARRPRQVLMTLAVLLVLLWLRRMWTHREHWCDERPVNKVSKAGTCPRLAHSFESDDGDGVSPVASEIDACTARLAANVEYRRQRNSVPRPKEPARPPPSGITVVTAFFVIRSKHASDRYAEWFCNFRRSARFNVYVFTDRLGESAMRRCQVHGCVHFDVRRDVWDVGNMTHYRESYEDQLELDPERGLVQHTPDLYAIWNAKIQMLREVAAWNPFDSETFLWVDMGSFRVPNTWFGPRWPDPAAYRALGVPKENILVSLISHPLWASWSLGEELPLSGRCESSEYVQGGFFGGSAQALEWWSREFFAVHDHALRTGRFVGKDQRIMNAVATLNGDRVSVINSPEAHRCGGDVWFVFQHALADPQYRCDGCSIPPTRPFSWFLPGIFRRVWDRLNPP